MGAFSDTSKLLPSSLCSKLGKHLWVLVVCIDFYCSFAFFFLPDPPFYEERVMSPPHWQHLINQASEEEKQNNIKDLLYIEHIGSISYLLSVSSFWNINICQKNIWFWVCFIWLRMLFFQKLWLKCYLLVHKVAFFILVVVMGDDFFQNLPTT